MAAADGGARQSAVVQQVEQAVRRHLEDSGVDSSHDWWHIHRVRNLALSIAREEGLPAGSLETVELAALVHDLQDWKYHGLPAPGGGGALQKPTAKGVLEQAGSGEQQVAAVLDIVDRMGFKESLGASAGAASAGALAPAELAAVQDADRLDAIGAVGIARCLTFGGRFNRVLYDPSVPPREGLTKQQYMAGGAKQTTINHFHEKLFKLKGMMLTGAGRRRAGERHSHMQAFLCQFLLEWDGAA